MQCEQLHSAMLSIMHNNIHRHRWCVGKGCLGGTYVCIAVIRVRSTRSRGRRDGSRSSIETLEGGTSMKLLGSIAAVSAIAIMGTLAALAAPGPAAKHGGI